MTANLMIKLDRRNAVNNMNSTELTQKEVAKYTADMMLELRHLAKSAELTTLQSLIELAYYEAFAVANPVVIPEEEKVRLREMEVEGRKVASSA